MDYYWVLLPYERKIHINDINYKLDTALPIKDAEKFEENDCGAMDSSHKLVFDINEEFSVVPVVLIDYNEFPAHCQSVDLLDCTLYSNTHVLMCCNEDIRSEYLHRLRAPSVLTIHIKSDGIIPEETCVIIDNFLDGLKSETEAL